MNGTNDILSIKVLNCSTGDLLKIIDKAAEEKEQILISYANVNTVNLAFADPGFKKLLDENYILHPDGIGVYFASGFLNKGSKNKCRFSGSDFYPELISHSVKKGYRLFFFGHDDVTLKKIGAVNPVLKICGYAEGYNYNNEILINNINNQNPDILIVGLGQPLQEEWCVRFKSKLDCGVILAVGDGIKVFAGQKKRGPVIMQKAGLEWLVRLILDPLNYWKRYLLGNPLFLYRIIKAKFVKLWK